MSRRRNLALLLGAVVLNLVWGEDYIMRISVHHEDTRVFTLWDDAMIAMQYARNLSHGDGLVWNAGGDRVQGFANLGVVLVMAATHRPPVSSTVLIGKRNCVFSDVR